MKLKTKILEGQWVEYKPGVKFKLRPFSFFASSIKPNVAFDNSMSGDDLASIMNSLEETFKMFDYILIDWEGVTDDDGQPVECNTENKRSMFEFAKEIAEFISRKGQELRDGFVIPDEEVKN